MQFKKIMSSILALTISASCFCVSALAEKVSFDFEGDNSLWYNSGEGDGTTVTNVINQDVTEDGNTFRRLGFDMAVTGSDNQVGNVLYMPATTIVLDEPIPFIEGQTIKISSKIRSNNFGSNYRVMPGIAINVPERAYKKEVIETLTGGVHAWNKFFNTIYKVDYSSGSKVFSMASGNSQWGATAGLNWGAYWMIPNSDSVSSNLSANTWYKVDSYLTIGLIDGVAKIEKVRTVVNDGELGDVETVVNSNTKHGKVSLQNETNLQSLHLFTGWRSPAGTKTGITVDFDDITIDVIVQGNITLKNAALVDGYAEYYLESDIPIDNPEEIYIHDGMGGTISCDVSYDEDARIITLRSNEEMAGMTYAISGLDSLKSNGALVEAIEDILVGVPEKMPIDEEFDTLPGEWISGSGGNITVSNGELIYSASEHSFISRIINSGMGILEGDVNLRTSIKKQSGGAAKLQLNRKFMGGGSNYDSVVTVSDSEIKIGDEVVANGEFADKKIDIYVNVNCNEKVAECYVLTEDSKVYSKVVELSNGANNLSFVGFESDADLSVDYIYIAPLEERNEKVLLEGLAETGEKITVTLNFAEESMKDYTLDWMVADEADGSYSVIDGANGLKFNVTEDYDGKFIKVVLISADSEKTESNVVSKRLPPIVENVSISGERYTGEVLQGSYEFSDPNMDKEGKTTFRWLRSSSEKGTYEPIEGATEISYTLTDSDVGKWLKLEVTPVSENVPAVGESVLSDAFKGSVLPEAKNVKISKTAGGMYTGNYIYYHEYGAKEGDTKFEWYADGELVSEEISYKPSASDKKLVFRITPVAERAPFEGEPIEVSTSVKKSSGGGGGSSGGGGVTSIVIGSTAQNVIDKVQEESRENEKQEALQKEPVIDVLGHWSEEYAKNVLGKNIMSVDSEKKFYPDRTVTRAEIVTYLFKAMEYSETEYKNEFADVSADAEYAGYLQTFVDKGIISKDIIFRPDDNVSRQEVCKILSIMLGMGESDASLDKYIDKDLIGDWAVKHVKNMISAGIMIGVSDNAFSPRTNITNAQMAKIITVIMQGDNQNNEPIEVQQETIDLSSDEFRVAFIGGSLTELGEKWQQVTVDALKEKIPGKKFKFINKGLGGTGSGYGAARFENDVLSFEPDIVFIEFAVNDKNSDEVNAKRYMEQMVRMCQEAKKQPAVVFLFAPAPTETLQNSLDNWQNGVNWKSEVAKHYGIKTVNIHEYIMSEYEKLNETRPTYTLTQYYIDNGWKQTGEDSFDVHGGYGKYGEAIEKAIDEEFEAFIRKPKNVGIYCKENETVTDYEIIKVDDSRLKFTGEWTKCENGYKPADSNLNIRQLHLDYFEKGLMQNSKGNASFEISTDAASVNLQIISSKIGNSATVYVDGVEKGKVVTKNTNAGMNYSTGWIDLPNDGKEHLVKYELNNDAENYVFTLGSVMTRRYR